MPLVRPFFEAADRGEFQIVTSILTLTEVLVHPLRRGDHVLAINTGVFFFAQDR